MLCVEGRWTCSFCLEPNSAGRFECNNCNEKRPGVLWSCSACSEPNKEYRAECANCGSKRPFDPNKCTLWVYSPINDRAVFTRSDPHNKAAETNRMLKPETVFFVSEEKAGLWENHHTSSALYLKLADEGGWLWDADPASGTMCLPVDPAEVIRVGSYVQMRGIPSGGEKAMVERRVINLTPAEEDRYIVRFSTEKKDHNTCKLKDLKSLAAEHGRPTCLTIKFGDRFDAGACTKFVEVAFTRRPLGIHFSQEVSNRLAPCALVGGVAKEGQAQELCIQPGWFVFEVNGVGAQHFSDGNHAMYMRHFWPLLVRGALVLPEPNIQEVGARPTILRSGGLRQRDVCPMRWSMSLRQWHLFMRACRSTSAWSELKHDLGGLVNTYMVNRYFVTPWTKETGRSIALMMNPDPKKADLMLSHSWAEDIDKVEDCLRQVQVAKQQAIPECTYVFFCTFSLYQAEDEHGPSIEEQVRQDPFAKIIGSKPAYGMAVLHTLAADLYTRLWCGYEIYNAVQHGVRAFAVYPDEQSYTSFFDFDVELQLALCTREQDELMIRGKIEQLPGSYKALNIVCMQFRYFSMHPNHTQDQFNEYLRRRGFLADDEMTLSEWIPFVDMCPFQ